MKLIVENYEDVAITDHGIEIDGFSLRQIHPEVEGEMNFQLLTPAQFKALDDAEKKRLFLNGILQLNTVIGELNKSNAAYASFAGRFLMNLMHDRNFYAVDQDKHDLLMKALLLIKTPMLAKSNMINDDMSAHLQNFADSIASVKKDSRSQNLCGFASLLLTAVCITLCVLSTVATCLTAGAAIALAVLTGLAAGSFSLASSRLFSLSKHTNKLADSMQPLYDSAEQAVEAAKISPTPMG